MVIGILFWVLTALCSGLTIWWGGRAGRWGVAIFLAAVVATHYAMKEHQRWASPNLALFLVDTSQFIALCVLAFRSGRYWPIWSAGFQLLAALTSVAILIDSNAAPRLYRALETVWALPMLLTMAAGTWIDAKADRRRP